MGGIRGETIIKVVVGEEIRGIIIKQVKDSGLGIEEGISSNNSRDVVVAVEGGTIVRVVVAVGEDANGGVAKLDHHHYPTNQPLLFYPPLPYAVSANITQLRNLHLVACAGGSST